MKNLLENDFITHYGLTVRITVNVDVKNDISIELRDVTPVGVGIARYSNSGCKDVNIINYESFINSLPATFQTSRKKCDFIVYTADASHFLLNELTDTNPKYIPDFTQPNGKQRTGKRNKAISQLTQTLKDIYTVPAINTFIKQHITKHCCFFNTQAHAPLGIVAITAFNRLSSITPNGYKMSSPTIEAFDFELWEFSGNQTYLLEDKLPNIKIIAEQLSKLSTKEVKKLTEILKS